MSTELNGKSVVVTGATSGIGYQAALDFAREGAFVIGVGRNPERCNQALKNILAHHPKVSVTFLVVDLSSQLAIHSLAEQVRAALQKAGRENLDVLVNNAGVYCDRKTLSPEGIEMTFAVNHLSPFLLTHLLLSLLKSDNSRVITVSSDSHYRTWFDPRRAGNPLFYLGFWAYKVSKLANVLFTAEFNRRNPAASPRAFSVDPGLVNTDIGLKNAGTLVSKAWSYRQKQGTNPAVPARTILTVASEPDIQASPDIYWYDSHPKQPSRAALDPQLAAHLWEESCRLCRIKDYFK